MRGSCPTCQRVFDLSDEFLSMGGKAKCPHCLEELVFQGSPSSRPVADRRLDQTRIDPNRNRSATRVDPEEVDARCPACDRRFKIDSEFLRQGGEARCPHCDEDLAFDVPQPAPPPKPPPEDLWDEETGKTLEVGHLGPGALAGPAADDGLEQAEYPEDSGESQIPQDSEYPEDSGEGQWPEDPYAQTGEVSLPELAGFGGASQDQEPGVEGEDLDEDALPTQVMSSPFASGESAGDDLDMPTPEESPFEEEGPGDFEPGAGDEFEGQADGELEQEAGGEFEEQEDDELGQETAGELEDDADEDFAGDTGRVIVGSLEQPPAPDAEPAGDELAFSPETSRETLEGLGASLDQDLAAEQDQAEAPSLQDEETEGAAGDENALPGPYEATREVSAVEPPPEAYPDSDQPSDEEPAEADTQSGSGAPFGALAEKGDWAAAAAAWAESGFSADQMPSFIRGEAPQPGSEQPSAEQPAAEVPEPVERTAPDGQGLEQLRGRGLLADAPPDSVEVSDADIIMLDDGEVEELVDEKPARPPTERIDRTAAGGDRAAVSGRPAVAVRAAARPAAGPRARGGPSFLSHLTNPPVLAGVLGLLALAIIGLLWFWLGRSEDVAGIAFPEKGVEAERVDAPSPADNQAKKTAVAAYGMGNRQAHLGHFEQAIQEYQRASSIDPGYANPHRAMGAIYAAMGKRDLSRAAYQTYLQLAPSSPDAEQVRQILTRYRSE